MSLQVQITTAIFSFIFGMLFSFFLRINYKIVYNSHKAIKLLGTFLVVIIAVMAYFLLLQKLNNALFHPYHLLLVIIGFIVSHFLEQKIVKHLKK